MLLFYWKWIRPLWAAKNPQIDLVASTVFLETESGLALSPARITALTKKSAKFFLDRNVEPTVLSLRHAFATYYWKEWRNQRIWSDVYHVEDFLRRLGFRLNTSPSMLQEIYIVERYVLNYDGDTLIPYSDE